jgi:hypothetical protein
VSRIQYFRIFAFGWICVVVGTCFGFWISDAHAYTLAQPTQLPPVEIVEGSGVGYTSPGMPISVSADAGRRVWLHEVGHHVDYTIPASDPFRYRFRELIGDTREWRTSPNSPHEKFAEAYAMCARRDPAKVTLSWLRSDFGYDYRPSVRKHRLVCRTIENATARYPDLFN